MSRKHFCFLNSEFNAFGEKPSLRELYQALKHTLFLLYQSSKPLNHKNQSLIDNGGREVWKKCHVFFEWPERTLNAFFFLWHEIVGALFDQ